MLTPVRAAHARDRQHGRQPRIKAKASRRRMALARGDHIIGIEQRPDLHILDCVIEDRDRQIGVCGPQFVHRCLWPGRHNPIHHG
jgi:hypothetical protein